MTPRQIPFHRPSVSEAEIAAVADVMRSGWLTTGANTTAFEKEFSDYVGAPAAVAVNSCTSGLQLALTALGVGSGDEVITSPITYCATVQAIHHTGARAVLADVTSDGNIDPASVASRITPRTKVLLPVHLGGNPCDMEAIWSLARAHNLRVVEDAAHALSARYGAGLIGGDPRSDAAAFSFYATKTLTTGEGGMVTTHNADLAERMHLLCHHGITNRNDWHYDVAELGFKFNLGNIPSAMGREQLKQQEAFLAAREKIAAIYREELSDLVEVLPGGCWHLFRIALRLDPTEISRDDFIIEMKRSGVGCSVHFIPIPLHSFFAEWVALPENACPRALELYSRLVSLPIYPSMSDDDVRYVAYSVRASLRTRTPNTQPR